MNNRFSWLKAIRLLVCVVFDAAVILAFFKAFLLFSILAPDKSVLMLLVLIISLAALNLAIFAPEVFYNKIGTAYTASIVTLTLLYSIIANILSIFLIKGSTVWYMVWELILFAVFLGIAGIILSYANRLSEEGCKVKKEQSGKTSVQLRLMDIEEALNRNYKGEDSVISSFSKLKERMNASTPFGRINGNHTVSEIEDRISSNLAALKTAVSAYSDNNNPQDVVELIEDTQRLVVNREKLSII